MTPETIERLEGLLAKTTKNELGCLIWQKARNSRGYGVTYFEGKHTTAHRAVMQISLGRALSAGEVVCHSCDTPSCVNPDHLFVGTQRDNMQDMLRKGRGNFAKSASHRAAISDSVQQAIADGRLPVKRGVSSPRAKLSEEDVGKIIIDGRSQRAIASEYGVDQTLISQIKTGKVWADHPIRKAIENLPELLASLKEARTDVERATRALERIDGEAAKAFPGPCGAPFLTALATSVREIASAARQSLKGNPDGQ